MNRVRRQLARWHRSENGAVALMCLAAILILFMTVLIMFDASRATQAKTDVQIGADSAAYSAGATGARAMNMVSFANVGKRTAVGIHNMYVYEYNAYSNWVDQMCGCCCECAIACCPNITCCRNCIGNNISFIPLIEWIDMLLYSLGNDLFDNLEELNDFQVALSDIAKTWSAGEAHLMGVRNNANMMAVWPDPASTDDTYMQLPIALSDYKSESCLAPIVPFNQRNPSTNWTALEFIVNWQVLIDRSTSSPNIASDGPAEVAEGSAYRGPGPAVVRAVQACMGLDNILFAFGHGIWALIAQLGVPDEAAPQFLDVASVSNPWSTAEDGLKMSYILFSYKHTPQLGRKFRDNYDFLSGPQYEYQRNDNFMDMNSRSTVGGSSTSASFPETGVFGMARSEFYFPPANQPDMNEEGEHEMWMFHPGWMGKLRPFILPYEVQGDSDMQISFNDIVQESVPSGAALANSMFNITSVDHYDSAGFLADQQYLLQNVGPDMVGGADYSDGYHHYLDGTAK